MTHLVTGYKGEEHIKSEDQGSFNASFFGTGQFVMEAGSQLEASITSNNNVRVFDGDILMKGRHIRINPNTYEDMTITTGTAGVNRNDLIVMTYQKNATDGTEDAFLEVIKGTETASTASDPAYTDGDILGGATLNQMPLYRVKLEGVVLTAIEPLFDVIPTYATLAEQYKQEFIDACESHLESLNVYDTMEEVEANTQENQLAGALAVKELKTNITSVRDLKTYTSLSQLGKTIDSVTSLNGLLPNDSQLTLTVNNAEKDALYNKGIIPVSAAGVLIVTNYNMRGEARFIQDMIKSIYVGQTSNAWNTDYDWKRLNAYIELTGTLTAGETTITLTDDSITTGRKFDFYTSIYGVSPTNVTVADGNITLEFDAQETDMNVEVRVM